MSASPPWHEDSNSDAPEILRDDDSESGDLELVVEVSIRSGDTHQRLPPVRVKMEESGSPMHVRIGLQGKMK